MLGSSRREKGVKIYREFDWWNFYSNVNCLGWNSLIADALSVASYMAHLLRLYCDRSLRPKNG